MTSTMISAWVDGVLKPVEKLEVHRRGLRHPAISVFINDGRRTLLQKRAAMKYHTPGLWANACCTHPHIGEDVIACAARRLGEELGIDGVHLTPRDRIEYRARVGNGLTEHEVVQLFTADVAETDLTLAPNPEEVAETQWIDIDALREQITAHPERFTPWLKIYVKEHAPVIFGQVA